MYVRRPMFSLLFANRDLVTAAAHFLPLSLSLYLTRSLAVPNGHDHAAGQCLLTPFSALLANTIPTTYVRCPVLHVLAACPAHSHFAILHALAACLPCNHMLSLSHVSLSRDVCSFSVASLSHVTYALSQSRLSLT